MPINFRDIPSPCYVIDETLLQKNIRLIKDVADQSGAKIILALKGFAMWKTFPYFRPYFSGTTASSLHEARLGHEEFGGEVHMYSPSYIKSEFGEIMSFCNHITFNSLTECERFRGVVSASSQDIACALRINPEHSEVSCDLYNPSVPGSRLGITAEKLGDRLPEGISGLHFHNLCEGDSLALERTLDAVEAKFGRYLQQIQWLNMGGGHLITRKGYDTAHLIRLIRGVQEKYGVSVILEPGAAFVWETGYLVSTVLDIVEHKGIFMLMLDTSVAAHMPDCLEMPYKPRIIGAGDAVPGQPRYRIGGLTCMAGDYVGDYSFEKEPRVGDQIVFSDMIHYTFVKNNTFNGVRLPSLGIWKEDTGFELFRKFGYKDYKERLS